MKKIDRTKLSYFVLGVVLVGLFLFFSYSRVFDEFEYSTLDFRYRSRPPQKAPENIAIIEISDDSIAKIGEWPFPRNYHALLIKALNSAGARTIIFDVFFSEKTKDDKEFAKTISESGNVFIPYVFDLDREKLDKTHAYATGYAASSIKEIQQASAGAGFVNVIPDRDGKVRRVPLFIEYEGEYYPQITFLAALNEMGYRFEDVKIFPGERVVIGEDMIIPLDYDSSLLVNFVDRWGGTFRHYSYVDVIQSYLADITGQEPIIDLEELKDSVCFIGMTATASPDAHPSPMESMYPGVGVHTSVYSSIMKNNFLMRLGRWWNLLILVLMWVATAYLTSKSRKRFAIFSILLIMVGYVVTTGVIFTVFGIWVDAFYPLASIGAVYVIFTFRKYLVETQKRELIEKELNIAKDIQRSFLPKEIPEVGGIKVDAKMITARQVGGDLYDVIKLDDERMGLMLGDVSGKGVPAALYMAEVVSVFRTYVHEGSASEVVRKVNDRLIRESNTNLFVTLTYMILDTKTHTATFSIGGHLPTVLIEPDGNIELLDVSEGMPLGMIESDFVEGERKYKPGSIFVLYTDGVTEAMDVRENMFGQERLVELCRTLAGKSPQEVVDAVHEAVEQFAGKAKQHDDITVMAIKI